MNLDKEPNDFPDENELDNDFRFSLEMVSASSRENGYGYKFKLPEKKNASQPNEEIVQEFLQDHPSLPIPDFSKIYDIDLDPETKAALELNFIKRSYIVGHSCHIDYYSRENGQPLSPDISIILFRYNYPEIEVPNLPPEQTLEYLRYHYETESDLSVLKRKLKLSKKKVKEIKDKTPIGTFAGINVGIRGIDRSAIPEDYIAHAPSCTQELINYELPKMAWQKYLIALAQIALDDYLRKLGIETIQIPMERVHMVPDQKILLYFGNHSTYEALSNHIFISDTNNPLGILDMSIHEIAHAKSSKMFHFNLNDKSFYLCRFATLDIDLNDEEPFSPLNESLTEEITIRVMKSEKIQQDEYVKQRIQIKSWAARDLDFSIDELVGLSNPNDEGMMAIIDRGYKKERRIFNKLVKKIAFFSHGKYTTEQIFEAFVRMSFKTGSTEEIIEIFKNSFGVGTMKKIFSINNTQEFYDYVSSLGDIYAKLKPLYELNNDYLKKDADNPNNPLNRSYLELQDRIDQLESLL